MDVNGKRVLVVGLGRLGGALATQLQARGWAVRVRTRSPSGRRAAKALRLREATEAETRAAPLCFLTVPDGAVASVVDGTRLLSPESIARARAERSFGLDPILGETTRFGLGYMLPHAGAPFGASTMNHKR